MNKKLKLEELGRISVDEFKTTEKIPVVVIMEDIRSGNNVGSLFRTSDAFLVEKIYLTGITAQPPHRDIQKTALGATESVEWEHRSESLPLVEELKSAGYHVMAIEQAENTTSLEKWLPRGQKLAVVFGNEVKGVSQEVIDYCDECLEIPQFGTKHSLNVSVCAGIVLWHVSRALQEN
jgi:23S rRNA (guanosine2251-2'-O)-methyltransferase